MDTNTRIVHRIVHMNRNNSLRKKARPANDNGGQFVTKLFVKTGKLIY